VRHDTCDIQDRKVLHLVEYQTPVRILRTVFGMFERRQLYFPVGDFPAAWHFESQAVTRSLGLPRRWHFEVEEQFRRLPRSDLKCQALLAAQIDTGHLPQ
jgi:hypothetical protein